ncbi:aminopeptidase P family protein, partial [Candidatus Peregrinibacteria bacterium]|nr:aminopeptidase P family protein [Candidatus Peregrinibacteria bacterium]
ATRFLCGDPFIFIEIDGKKMLVMSDLEFGRAKNQAKVDKVLSYSEIEKRLKTRGAQSPTNIDVICEVLRQHNIKNILVPYNFWIETTDQLRARGFKITYKKEPFYEKRIIKTKDEIAKIERTQQMVNRATDKAIKVLREARIKGNRIYHDGKALTAEDIKEIINVDLMRQGAVNGGPIVACGDQGCDPHNSGTGPLAPHKSIVLDIFPKATDTMYCADMSRTVVKGKPSPELKKIYQAVKDAQQLGCDLVRDGSDGKFVHTKVAEVLEKRGYKTYKRNGKWEGFFHGTGHGLGLDVHEPPRVSKAGSVLKEGMVVTVEPGLYYWGIGAVRIEDMVAVEKTSSRNLTKYPKFFEIE